MDSPSTITDGDESSIKVFRQTFPYFVPIRYLEAVEQNKRSAFSPDMLTTMQPYIGSWIMFCDFLEAGNRPPVVAEPTTPGNGEDFFQRIRGEVPEVVAPVEEIVATAMPVMPQPVYEQPAPAIEVPPVTAPAQPLMAAHNEPAQQSDSDTEIENEIVAEIINTPTENELPAEAAVVEPPVVVSDAFLQMIREEGLEQTRREEAEAAAKIMQPEPVAPMPVYEPQPEPVVEVEPVIVIPQDMPSQPLVQHVIAPEPVVIPEIIEPEIAETEEVTNYSEDQKPLIYPIYTQDYFLQQGEKVPDELPDEIDDLIETADIDDVDKSLMVMMSFSEWLLHFKNTSHKQEEEKKDQKALKTMWQKEKLAAAIEEENEEIPENVFEMAVNSITKEDGLASESLAEIYVKQGKYDKAMDMYRKLSLRNPQKNAYFARKIEEILKEKQS